jgi:hypothetical protein
MSSSWLSSSRREFLKRSVSVAAATGLGATWDTRALAYTKRSPNDRINLGVIGFGSRCTYDLRAILKNPDVRCLAIADVQSKRRDAGQALVDKHYDNHDCKVYRDFRELLARSDIDAVLIATGDRWHSPASILAAKAGKDVYSEKPCGITIAACQLLADTIRDEKRIFQAGTQRRSVGNFQKAIELVHAGKIGKLKTMHASVYVPELGNAWLPADPTPTRNELDWNLWLGPAPWRPFNHEYTDGHWRGQWDFDSGARLLDWGAHTVDLCQAANKADDTMPIEYEPSDSSIVCRYANGVQLVLDFLREPFGDRSPSYITRLGTCPVRFIGDEGWVETGDAGEIVTSSPTLQKDLIRYPKRGDGSDVAAHSKNLFDCMRSRKKTIANADVMRRSHTACHAAALAWILKRKLTLDPIKVEFDDDQANGLRSRPSREWAT